jgi:hypothetical protein
LTTEIKLTDENTQDTKLLSTSPKQYEINERNFSKVLTIALNADRKSYARELTRKTKKLLQFAVSALNKA